MFREMPGLIEQGRTPGWAQKQYLRPPESSIAGRLYLIGIEFKQADSMRARHIDVVPEGAGQVDSLELIACGAPALEQNTYPGRNSAFGQLQLSDIRLRDRNGRQEVQNLPAVGDSAAGQNLAKMKRGSHCVHQSASTNPARFAPAEHVAIEAAVLHGYSGDCSRRRAHPHTDARGLECRACSRRSAECAVPVSDDNLAIRAQINESDQRFAVEPAHCNHAREQVTPHEATEAG